MKKIIFFIILSFSFSQLPVFAQDEDVEKASPLYGAEIVRNVSRLDIEGVLYNDAKVFIKSSNFPYTRVKVKIKNPQGKIIWKRSLDAYLYVFSNGQVQVGKKNFDMLVIYSSGIPGVYKSGKIREKEGVY